MKKLITLSLLILLLLTGCENKKNQEYIYPIDQDENNIVLPIIIEDIDPNYESIKLYFYIYDENHREYDYTFSHVMDINNSIELDIRMVENKLILSNLEETMNQTIINFEEVFPDIFNENTKTNWFVGELRNEAIELFSNQGGLNKYQYFKSFKLYNEISGIEFDVAIETIDIRVTKYDTNLFNPGID